ncbi:MAG: DUF559 domain-containing protein, partial [Polyangiaceae bacterium]
RRAAASGGGSYGGVSPTLLARAHRRLLVRRLGPVVGSSHARGRTRRASPGMGVVFRRQVPLLGRFIADFFAPPRRLVIEVDGAYHAERGLADARRVVARAGYRVVRIEASLVVSDIECAVAEIGAALLTV